MLSAIVVQALTAGMHSRDLGASLDDCLMLAAVPGDYRQGNPWCDIATDRAEAKNGTVLKLSI